MEELLSDGGFEQRRFDRVGLKHVDFAQAPPPPPDDQAIIYRREKPSGSAIEYLVTTPEHKEGWFVSLDY